MSKDYILKGGKMKKNKIVKIVISLVLVITSIAFNKNIINTNRKNNGENIHESFENKKILYDTYVPKYSDSMILEYDIDENNYELNVPILNISGSVTIYWGDGNNSIHTSNIATHTYTNSGKYIVEISNNFTRFSDIDGDKTLLICLMLLKMQKILFQLQSLSLEIM